MFSGTPRIEQEPKQKTCQGAGHETGKFELTAQWLVYGIKNIKVKPQILLKGGGGGGA